MNTKRALPNASQEELTAHNAGNSSYSDKSSFLERLTPKFIQEARQVRKESGYRGLVKRYGWKLFAVFFTYYLVRDSILYILLPYLIARGLF